jgi:hypothetical protein
MEIVLKNINVSTINEASVEMDETGFATQEDLQQLQNELNSFKL